jgi:predicted lipoprotein with Yx(FWY)xxD motif
VKRIWLLGATAAMVVLASGCGSSKKSASATGTGAAAPAPSTGTQAANTESGASAPAAAVTVSAKSNKLGSILAAGPRRMTVYLFEADKGGSSSCSGACAAVWPPVRATGALAARGAAAGAKLSQITRPDGTKQVAYNGHPLYFFARDGDKGDAYGQGLKSFGASWYVLSPSGSKIDKS